MKLNQNVENKQSLAKATMLSMAIRITIVIVLSTGAAYWHLQRVLTEQHLNMLSGYIKERGAREGQLFELAAGNHQTMAPRFLKALKEDYPGNVEKDFDRMFVHREDGSWRDRDPKINTNDEPTFYHGPQVEMTPELKKRLLIGKVFIRNYAHAYQGQFSDTYFTTPENSMLLFWPGLNWGGDAPKDLDMRKEEYIWVADPAHNPERKSKWTGMYYDVAAKI